MKGSLATSAVIHAVVLTWALVSLGSPESFDVANVEALPVDIVSIEELTQIQQGDKKAEMKEKAAPIPTKKQTPVENAENAGENDIDLKNLPTPEEKPRDIETAASPEKAEKVVQTPDTKPVEEVKKEEPASEPSTEVAAVAEAKQEVKPDPKPEATPSEEKPAEDPEADAAMAEMSCEGEAVGTGPDDGYVRVAGHAFRISPKVRVGPRLWNWLTSLGGR